MRQSSAEVRMAVKVFHARLFLAEGPPGLFLVGGIFHAQRGNAGLQEFTLPLLLPLPGFVGNPPPVVSSRPWMPAGVFGNVARTAGCFVADLIITVLLVEIVRQIIKND